MYVPEFFKLSADEARRHIEENSFGILVSHVHGKILATHIPLVLIKNAAGQEVLSGHISKANAQSLQFDPGEEVLCIFQGPHAYISSSWYDHENVPTWNYIAVHVYGKPRMIEGEELLQSLKALVDKYEKGSEHPVSLEKMSDQFLSREIRGITAFQIEISRIEGAKKLSQNRDQKNHDAIAGQLERSGDPQSLAVAAQMKKLKSDQ